MKEPKDREINDRLKSLEEGQGKIKGLLLSQKMTLSFKELIEYTGFSKSTLYKLNMERKIPGVCKPTGGKLFFDRRKIDTWLLANPNDGN